LRWRPGSYALIGKRYGSHGCTNDERAANKQFGITDWSVLVEQAFSQDPGRVRMTARGRLLLGTAEIEGMHGGEFNNTSYLDSKWGQVSAELDQAVRGWSPGKPEDRFKISLDSETENARMLQMSNSFGTYTWSR
jgi:hypothetical protein